MTGDLNREIFVGLNWEDSSLSKRVFRFSSFSFPSCKACNDKFGAIERKAKLILLDVMDDKVITQEEGDVLLDWFDKVRTGLWLSSLILNKNHNGVKPHYYISDRVGKADRALFVYKTKNEPKGISFIASDSPVFQIMPSVFALKINDYYFVSISTDLILHKSLGLVGEQIKEIDSITELNLYSVTEGDGEIKVPDFISDFPKKCMVFLQGIKPKYVNQMNDKKSSETDANSFSLLYKNEHALNLFSNGKSKIIIIKDEEIYFLSDLNEAKIDITEEPTIILKSDGFYNQLVFRKKLGSFILDFQRKLYVSSYQDSQINGENSELMMEGFKHTLAIHDKVTEIYNGSKKYRSDI